MTYPIQNHIHLDLPENLGGAPENAPPQTFTVTDRSPTYEFTADFARSWTGRPFFASLVDDEGVPCFFTNMRYTLRVTQSELETLQSLALRHVLFCDNFHPATDTDHTGAIQHMRLFEMKYIRNIDPVLNKHEVSILLLPEPSEYAT